MKQWTVERTLLSLTKKKINATEHSFRKNLVTQYTCQIMKSCTNDNDNGCARLYEDIGEMK